MSAKSLRRQKACFYVVYKADWAPPDAQWKTFASRVMTYMEACEETEKLSFAFPKYRFKPMHERLLVK